MKSRRKSKGGDFERLSTSKIRNLDAEIILQELKVKKDAEERQFDSATRDRIYIISVNNTYNFYWRLFIIFLAVYNAIALPMQMAFKEVSDVYNDTSGLQILE